jgi:hypothetical protein
MKLKLMQKLTMAAIATFLLAPVYGSVTGPGTISSLSANALDRSGYLEVLGSNFGGSGQVLVDGISAPRRRLGEHAHRRLRPGGGALDHSAGASCQRVEPA